MPDKAVNLCSLDQLADGASLGLDPFKEGRDTLFVVRQGETIRAYQNDCPHWPGSPMAWRKHEYLATDKKHIICYSHGARFDIESGLCLSGPCLGESLQALPIRISSDGTVYLLTDESAPEKSAP
tara:strand:+ start:52577 stop:52951 length:375 start_codon:yes stop_codon:yes gene_type:complete